MTTRPSTETALVARVEPGDELSRIVLSGRLDRDGEAVLGEAYAAAAAAGTPAVEVDFGDVDYINSTGIALVVRLLADARRDGRPVQARGLTEHYREIFRITRLSDLMTIMDEGDAA
jgi:anti-sigma B factor antagonist